MSLTFSITPTGANAIEYKAISVANTSGQYRQAIDFDAGAQHQQQFRFHAPGVAGQYLIRDASVGRAVRVMVRYIGPSKALAEEAYQTDAGSFATTQVQLDCNGQTYKGCNILPESVKRSTPIRGTGRLQGQVFFNVSMIFTQDNPGGL